MGAAPPELVAFLDSSTNIAVLRTSNEELIQQKLLPNFRKLARPCRPRRLHLLQRHAGFDRFPDLIRAADDVERVLLELVFVGVALPFELARIEVVRRLD